MIYKKIIPEIMVDLGERTVFEDLRHPYHILRLHIHLESWAGDDLLEIAPCFIVTERLMRSLLDSEFTGFHFDDVEVTTDQYFEDNYNLDKDLPDFYWMKVNGMENKDDLFISDDYLFISERLLKYLQNKFSIKNSQIEPERNEFDDLLDDIFAKRDAKNKPHGPKDNPDNKWLPPNWNE